MGPPETVLVDIDGTLALHVGRTPFQWHRVDEDVPNAAVVRLVQQLALASTVVFISARDEVCREDTQQWLDRHVGVAGPLFMRPHNDPRKDSVLKELMYTKEIADQYAVWLVIDDRNQVVEMWRRLGLTCAQVASGDF